MLADEHWRHFFIRIMTIVNKSYPSLKKSSISKISFLSAV